MEKSKVSSPPPDEIRAFRIRARITQATAASMIHATLRAWEDWEQGRRNMPAAKWELFLLKTRGPLDNP